MGEILADEGQPEATGPAREEAPQEAARHPAQAPGLSGTQPPFGSRASSFAPVPPGAGPEAGPQAPPDSPAGPQPAAGGFESPGYAGAGYGPEYYGPAGYGIEDYGSTGYGFADYGPAGYGIEDYGPAAYETSSEDYPPAAYGIADYGPPPGGGEPGPGRNPAEQYSSQAGHPGSQSVSGSPQPGSGSPQFVPGSRQAEERQAPGAPQESPAFGAPGYGPPDPYGPAGSRGLPVSGAEGPAPASAPGPGPGAAGPYGGSAAPRAQAVPGLTDPGGGPGSHRAPEFPRSRPGGSNGGSASAAEGPPAARAAGAGRQAAASGPGPQPASGPGSQAATGPVPQGAGGYQPQAPAAYPPGGAYVTPEAYGSAVGAAAAGQFGPAGRGEAGTRLRPPMEGTEQLTPELLLPGRRRAPAPGWRRLIYQTTGGILRVPMSAAELRRQDMIGRARAPVAGGHHRVAVMSLKGGVGKTTTAMGLGSTLAALRGDRVIAVDANPDRGTLSDKVPLETAATIRDLLNERSHVRRYADVRTFTSQAASRLEILASDRDPTVSVAFSEEDYCNVCAVLEHYYSICLTDCGTGLMHSAMAGVLRLADQVVMVSTPSVDGARSASATLDWLEAHGYGDLVRDAVVVLCAVRPRSRSSVDLGRLEDYFGARCRAVTRIPYDPHLEEGAEIELDLLSRATSDGYLALAAIVGDGLARPRGYALHAPRAG